MFRSEGIRKAMPHRRSRWQLLEFEGGKTLFKLKFSYRLLTNLHVQGSRQWIKLKFMEPVKVSELKVTFQGGFTCRTMKVQCLTGGEASLETVLHPSDGNNCQNFPLEHLTCSETLKIVFEEPCDFYGRIVIYGIDVIGSKFSWFPFHHCMRTTSIG